MRILMILGFSVIAKSLPLNKEDLSRERRAKTEAAIYAQFNAIFPELPKEGEPLKIGDYYSLRQIEDFMENTAKNHENVSVLEVGRSWQNRKIIGIKFGDDEEKPFVVIDAGIHAREWTSIHVAYYLIDKYSSLLANKDERFLRYLENFNIVIIPVLNPDGFIYTREQNVEPFKHRLWRKNRSPTRCFSRVKCCEGVDLNRNWDISFTGSDSKLEDPCSDVYSGPQAFSEPETRSYSLWLSSLKKLDVYITLHSHGQLWLYPYAYARGVFPKNIERTVHVAEKVVDAIQKFNGTRYYHGSPADMLYTSTGSSMDWVQRNLDPQFAFTVEVRPLTEEYGFILEQSLLISASEEVAIGVDVVIDQTIHFQQHPFQFTGTTRRPMDDRLTELEQRDPVVDRSEEKIDDILRKWIDS